MNKNPLKNIKISESPKDYEKIRKLYFNIPESDYFNFCRKMGYPVTNRKSKKTLKKEQLAYQQEFVQERECLLQNKLKKSNDIKKRQKKLNKSNVIELIEKNKNIEKLYSKLDSDKKKIFVDVILHLRRSWGKLNKREVLSYTPVEAYQVNTVWTLLYLIVYYRKYWVRNLSEFKSKGHNAHKIIYELYCFLLVKRDIPKGLMSLISKGEGEAWDYIINVSIGKSPKENVPTLIKIPKNKVSNLMKNLKKFDWNEAVRRTQWDWLKLDKNIQDDLFLIADMRIEGRNERIENHKLEFARYIGLQTMLDGNLFQSLWDYTQHLRANNTNFTYKGRNVFNLIEGMEEWHKELYDGEDPKKNFVWESSGIGGYSEDRTHKGTKYKIYIKELTSSALLNKEGRKQRHCVGSYAKSCKAGNTSIWSLREEFIENTPIIMATIEVRGQSIVQAKGFGNEPLSTKARAIIERWANNNNLDVRV